MTKGIFPSSIVNWLLMSFSTYLLLGFVLFVVERSNANSSINTFSDALSFSFLAITHFGNTTSFPASIAGRCIGMALDLLHYTFYAAVVGIGIWFGKTLKSSI